MARKARHHHHRRRKGSVLARLRHRDEHTGRMNLHRHQKHHNSKFQVAMAAWVGSLGVTSYLSRSETMLHLASGRRQPHQGSPLLLVKTR